jgi:hypothetical protein
MKNDRDELTENKTKEVAKNELQKNKNKIKKEAEVLSFKYKHKTTRS